MSSLHIAEPPAQYQVRPPIVVDCSALAGIVFREPWGEQASERLEARSLHAPYLLQVEIARVVPSTRSISTLFCLPSLSETKVSPKSQSVRPSSSKME